MPMKSPCGIGPAAMHARRQSLAEPTSEAARWAQQEWGGWVEELGSEEPADVLVDCLFGSGLTRPLTHDHAELLKRLAAAHHHAVAVDLPSGVQSDSGMLLTDRLPRYDFTIALGAWKFAHFLMPASAIMGALRLVGIGVGAVPGAARGPRTRSSPSASRSDRRS